MDALERYHEARARRDAATTAQRLTKRLVEATSDAESEARKVASRSVPCPSCGVGPGDRCFDIGKNGKRELTVSHGVRDDLSGVCGEYSRLRQLERMT